MSWTVVAAKPFARNSSSADFRIRSRVTTRFRLGRCCSLSDAGLIGGLFNNGATEAVNGLRLASGARHDRRPLPVGGALLQRAERVGSGAPFSVVPRADVAHLNHTQYNLSRPATAARLRH